jgi:hypothetical protein
MKMPKYKVIGYYSTPWFIEVEAEDEDVAEAHGYDALVYASEGREGEGEWVEFEVEEIE